ncbi:hypothetical protein VTO73DRAFT_8525 [Trametes versicolor]
MSANIEVEGERANGRQRYRRAVVGTRSDPSRVKSPQIVTSPFLIILLSSIISACLILIRPTSLLSFSPEYFSVH